MQSSDNNVLNGVSCLSSTSCVAGGYFYDGVEDQGLIETASGGTWAVGLEPSGYDAHNHDVVFISRPCLGEPGGHVHRHSACPHLTGAQLRLPTTVRRWPAAVPWL